MTTLPHIQLRDPDNPSRTILRVAFWLVLAILIAFLARSCADAGVGSTTRTEQAPERAEHRVPTPRDTTARTPIVPKRPEQATTNPRVSAKARSTSRTPPAARTPAHQPGSTTATTPTSSRPQPPRTTTTPAAADPVAPSPPTSTTEPTTITPVPELQAPAPPVPRPPSNHNCDAANESC